MKRNGKKSRNGHQVEAWPDAIERAWTREWEARRRQVPPMECESAMERVFECVCCGKTRPEEQRREPESEVCVRCVQEAGFLGG